MKGYSAEISADSISIILAGETVATLVPRCAVNTTNDDNVSASVDVEMEGISFAKISDCPTTFTWTSESSLWKEKVCTLTCLEDRMDFSVTLKGKGRVDSIKYFTYNLTESLPVTSTHEFNRGFFPNIYERGTYGTYEADKRHDSYSLLTVPPMFFHSFEISGIENELSFGLVAAKGEHNFMKFIYDPSMYFETTQHGHVKVDGEWTSPAVVVYTASDSYDAASKYCNLYFDAEIYPRGNSDPKPRFWYGPIACGWFEQFAVFEPEVEWVALMSTEATYVNMKAKLKEKGLHPSILIIDDKWMDQYATARPHPERFPDLRRFIDKTKEEDGIHTFLWFKLWDSQGVPEEYCVWDETTETYVCDPTNPGYREMLKETVRRLISDDDGCYNADGLKIDYAFTQPSGRRAVTYGSKYGPELLYEYIKLIHDTAKEVKPHAVINASPSHPMFAALVDQARLHDYDSNKKRTLEEFTHRGKIWGTALPDSLIDTDGGSISTRRDTMRFLLGQKDIGIPDLYHVSDFKDSINLTDEDWSRVAAEWQEYNEEMDRLYGKDTLV